MTEPLIGELFAGYGGLGMAVQDVYGGKLAWYSEFDDAPSRIMAHHHPGVPNYGDVTQIGWDEIPRVDILTGGFPCQDVSVAGRRAGMTDGTRSGLWSHMAHAIDVLRPHLVVIENVGGLFSANAASVMESHPWCLGDDGSGEHAVFLRAIDAVLSTLSELGYDAEWTALRAADVGAPHGRLRVFITAHPAPDSRCGGGGGWVAGPEPARGDDAPVGPDSRGDRGRDHLRLMPTPRATDGTKGGPNQRGSSGDLMLPSAVAHLLPTPSSVLAKGSQTHRSGSRSDELLLDGLAAAEAFGPYTPAIQRWEHVLGRPAPAPTEPGKTRPRLSARFVEFLMGLDDGHVTDVGLTRNQELKALGNGVVPQQGAAALRHLHQIRTTYLEEMTS